MKRRDFLLSLSLIAPGAQLLTALPASAATTAADPGVILTVSRVITGNNSLSPDVAARVETLLSKRMPGFAEKLADLAKALAGKDREAALAALSPDQVAFALDIAKPWYVGYVGSPSTTILKDDAEFVTFLEAQTYEKFLDAWPRPSSPDRNPGWWEMPPEGVDTSSLPKDIKSWSYQPADAPAEIAKPDPAWVLYVTKKYPSVDEARKAIASGAVPQN
jgi:fructose 5-dehydrogenase small subunit